jgi:hypothetical protein
MFILRNNPKHGIWLFAIIAIFGRAFVLMKFGADLEKKLRLMFSNFQDVECISWKIHGFDSRSSNNRKACSGSIEKSSCLSIFCSFASHI